MIDVSEKYCNMLDIFLINSYMYQRSIANMSDIFLFKKLFLLGHILEKYCKYV
jgi:hypothetical protein